MIIKDRLIILYTRSKINAVIWGLSFAFVFSYTAAAAILGSWFIAAAGVIGITAPFFLRNILLQYYHITGIILRISGPLILLSILSIPFIFGSLPHIPLPLRIIGFLYVALFSSSYFWIKSDPALYTDTEQ